MPAVAFDSGRLKRGRLYARRASETFGVVGGIGLVRVFM